MKTNWDYTGLADAYLKRPDYSQEAIDAILSISNVNANSTVCDIGAGVAHLTLMLAAKGLAVHAVEPNDAMRSNGIQRCEGLSNVFWTEGTGENTGQENMKFDLVTFGSSFNVCNRTLALNETARILKKNGWFACMWNHRDLQDPIQSSIEQIIKTKLVDYSYGNRREDQRKIISSSKLFKNILQLSGEVLHTQTINECVEAWRSHATLERQAGEEFNSIISEIEKLLNSLSTSTLTIPYKTNIWMAQLI